MGDFIDDRLEPFLKFALILGPGNQCAHVERVNLFHFQVFGHVSSHNSLRQPLDNRSLAGSWLTNKNRIILSATAQNLQHTADFVISSNDWVEFALAGTLIQVDGILAQCVILLLGAL